MGTRVSIHLFSHNLYFPIDVLAHNAYVVVTDKEDER